MLRFITRVSRTVMRVPPSRIFEPRLGWVIVHAGHAQPRRSAAGLQARWWKNVMRPLIQPWTMSPAAAGLETIHTMIRTATMMPMILDNNGLASRSGWAAAYLVAVRRAWQATP